MKRLDVVVNDWMYAYMNRKIVIVILSCHCEIALHASEFGLFGTYTIVFPLSAIRNF